MVLTGRRRQGDIYARYQCYGDAEDFAAAIRKSAPIKMDIGAVFNARPSEHKSLPAPIVPLEREWRRGAGSRIALTRFVCRGAHLRYRFDRLRQRANVLQQDQRVPKVLCLYDGGHQGAGRPAAQ